MNKELAEFVGLMAGDGCLSTSGSKHLIYISGHKHDDKEYHDTTTRKLLKELFNKEILIQFRKGEQTLFIRFSDAVIFNEMRKYLPIGKKYQEICVPKSISINKDFFFAFIRGLADTDGCVIFSKQHRDYPYYPRIEISSKSKTFLESILHLLKTHKFYGSVSRKGGDCFRLELPGKKNLEKWLFLIGFHNKKHLDKIKTPQTRYSCHE